MVKSLSDVKWKEFAVDALFDISGSKTTPKNRLENIGNGKYPYVTTQTTSNGQAGYFNLYTEKGKVLTVDSAVAGFTTYQANNFSASDHVEILTPKFQINKHVALFLTVQFNKNNQKKFSYGYKACQDRLRKMSIILPVNSKGEPDYEFMEEYIKEREAKLKEQYKSHVKARAEMLAKKMEMKPEWKEFLISKIFEIKAGKRLTKTNMKSGKIPFIGSSDSCNGITNFVSNENSSTDKNILGVNYNGSVVENFYHPYKCTFSDDVKRFSTIETKGNKYIYLFLKNAILKQKCKYMYGYKFNESRMKKQKIMLPIDSKGEPDYTYMENYMKYLEQKKLLEYLNYIK